MDNTNNTNNTNNTIDSKQYNDESYSVSALNIFLVLLFAICAALFVSCVLKFLKRK
jgi:hypothetical protein